MIYFEHTFTAMASSNVVQFYIADAALAPGIAARVEAEVRRIEQKYSRYRDDSALAKINRAAGAAAVPVDVETSFLLDHAAACYQISAGLFDITSGVLRRAWNFKTAQPPSQQRIDALLPLIGWDKVERDAGAVRLTRVGMELDFGGLGKEYAVDRASAVLHQQGVVHGLVSLGGDVRVLGPRPDGSPWPVHIAHPRQPGALFTSYHLSQGSLATSGDYMRYFDFEGRRYCHVLNPKSGWPATRWSSITVVSAICLDAGSIATIAMLLEEEALPFLQQRRENTLLIDASGRASATGALGSAGQAGAA